jgi:hypothetical protein
MEYSALAITEYERYANGLDTNTVAPMLNEVKETIAMQGQVLQAIEQSMLGMGSQFMESHGKVLEAINKPKTIIRDSQGKIKGVI